MTTQLTPAGDIIAATLPFPWCDLMAEMAKYSPLNDAFDPVRQSFIVQILHLEALYFAYKFPPSTEVH